ncbi:S-DNA-T family DNA segregation ATPase FtsK/SpoIIIE [Pullulanibacillus pueri]|uniref:DNA translocase SftA n=1 Tax=Pullulanibacillus pueri TaxID=1437324 RepID=A0A8J3A0R1_9BACL|nr:DNA translocase FtsK [Pullulanibacillus pueri]MBM7683975.1 S-DNA-T family DNA segregation ATPase FtsK/SpoIIIE [Pullulanibacillus pueri]GGH88129.1 DNA translocase SftA [Pullulanibacillus pueri]
MTNWWKRLFGFESDDDLYEGTGQTYRQPSQQDGFSPKGRIETSGKHIDVKMIRQYPSSYTSQKMPERQRQGKVSSEKEQDVYDVPAYTRSQRGKPSIGHSDASRGSREEHYRKEKPTYTRERKIEETQVNHKRFKPTEIPSPIYGFRKPNKSKKVSGGSSALGMSQQRKKAHEKQLVEDQKEQSEKEKAFIQSNLNHQDKVTDPSVMTESPPVEDSSGYVDVSSLLSGLISEEKQEEVNDTIDFIEPEANTGVEIEAEFEEQPLEDQVDVLDDQEEEYAEVETYEEDAMTFEEEVIESEDLKEEDTEVGETLPVNVEETGSQDEQSEDGSNLESEEATTNGIKDESVGLEEHGAKEDVNAHDNPTPERRRSNVPFNVLMFGADRVSMRRKETSQSTSSQRQTDRSQGQRIPSLSLDLLNNPNYNSDDNEEWVREKQEILAETLKNFHVKADIVGYVQGPSVTRFELKLYPGVKVNKILNLTEDIKLSMAAKQIRISPVPGKSIVGIEVPNTDRKPVFLKELLESESFRNSTSPLTATLGMDVSGQRVVTDLAKMPHGLIAGATGSGKSVCIHSLLLSLIYKTSPEDLRLILIDPKVVELAAYQALPHLAAPLITQPKEAALALKWAVEEMEERYQLFAKKGVRDINRYNKTIDQEQGEARMPFIVIVIDELADLMMASPQDVEEAICRIAQKARAAGIHMLLATQRPSVDVITGLIKSNIPTRIAFSVSSQADSRTILDAGGAERLLGQGDMLFVENGARDMKRLQGAFVTDEEIDRVTEALTKVEPLPYLFDLEQIQEMRAEIENDEDELFEDAALFVIDQGQASVSSLQRRFRIGYNRAARLVDQLEASEIISEANGSKPRQVLVDKETFSQYYYQANLDPETTL